MNRQRPGWLLPTAACSFVVMAALEGQSGASLLGYVIPGLLAAALFGLRRLQAPSRLLDAVPALRLLSSGVAIFAAATLGPPDHAWLKAASGLGQGLSAAAALLALVHLREPEGLLRTPASAVSFDALIVTIVLWSLATFLTLSRALFPELVDVSPPSIDTAFLFCDLGCLLLLVAVLVRARILRGLQLGVSDRTSAGLWLAVAGATIGSGSGLLQTATADRVASLTLIITSAAVTYCCVDPSAARVARVSRGTIALLLLGAPTTVIGAYLATKHPDRPASVALGVATVSLLVGVISHRASKPLGPAGSRWLDALSKAMTAALHPEPDIALRGALAALSRAEKGENQRVELFRFDPPRLVSVDIAGYLTERPVEFPAKIHELAQGEPGQTLRQATLARAQVRRPDVRPLVSWFSAHGAKSATALSDPDGPVGLLKMPEGHRTSPLTMEEVEMLEDLAERLTGVVSVTSALARAHERQLAAQELARSEGERAEALDAQLENQQEAGRPEAEMRAETVRRTAHGPAGQMALAEIQRLSSAAVVELQVPPGGDGLAWAACLHLLRGPCAGGFVTVDCTAPASRASGFYQGATNASPFGQDLNGTLVLVGSSVLVEEDWASIEKRTEGGRVHLVLCNQQRSRPEVPHVAIPRLTERAEDLASVINFELSRLGMMQLGRPFGIQRAALSLLLDQDYPGNEAELRGLLQAAASRATGDLLTSEDLSPALHPPPTTGRTEDMPPAGVTRRRQHVAPRSRRP